MEDIKMVMKERRVIEGDEVYEKDIMEMINGLSGEWMIVKGDIEKEERVKEEMVRMRLIKGENERNLKIRFEDGSKLMVID